MDLSIGCSLLQGECKLCISLLNVFCGLDDLCLPKVPDSALLGCASGNLLGYDRPLVAKLGVEGGQCSIFPIPPGVSSDCWIQVPSPSALQKSRLRLMLVGKEPSCSLLSTQVEFQKTQEKRILRRSAVQQVAPQGKLEEQSLPYIVDRFGHSYSG